MISEPSPMPLSSHDAIRHRQPAVLPIVMLALTAGCARVEPAQPTPPPIVEVAPVVRREMRTYREWVGTADGYVNAEIRPQVEGHLVRQRYREGSFVQKGEVLFEIDPVQLRTALDRASHDLSRNEAALARMEPDASRFAPFAVERAISQEELDIAPSTVREARANVEAARTAVEMARLKLGWTLIVSPIDGIAGSARAQVGALVDARTSLATVSMVDPIKVFFNPTRQDGLSWLKRRVPSERSPSTLPRNTGLFELILPDGSLYPYRGDPMPTGRELDMRSGMTTMAAIFPNPGHLLRPGQLGRIRAAVDVSKGALLIPERAVFEPQGVLQVAVVGPDNRVEIRTVVIGERVGSLWVIEEGLNPGDRVVVHGLRKVKPGMLVQPRPAAAEPAPRPRLTDAGD